MNGNDQNAQMRERLRRFYAQDPEERLLGAIIRRLEDPLQPKNAKGRFRLNPFLLLIGVIGALAGGAFLFFSFVHP